MSMIQPDPLKHRPGYWAYPAAEVSRCFTTMLTSNPTVTTRLSVGARDDIVAFFDQVEEVIINESIMHRDTYDLAVRVLRSCTDGSLLFSTVELDTFQDYDLELWILSNRFREVVNGQVVFSDAEFEELLRLIAFLHQLCAVEGGELISKCHGNRRPSKVWLH